MAWGAPLHLETSDEIGELAGALASAQGAMHHAERSAENPYFGSTYADLAACIDACRLPLSENALCVLQLMETIGKTPYLVTLLAHKSGQWVRGKMQVYPMTQKKGEGWVYSPDPQSLGSCITYCRRYCLQAILNLASEDDDGNKASGEKGKKGKAKVDTSGMDTGNCRSCGELIFWGQLNDKPHPYNRDGTTHFSTCPQADQHRKSKDDKKPEPAGRDMKQAQRATIHGMAMTCFRQGKKATKQEMANKDYWLHWVMREFFWPDKPLDKVTMTELTEEQADKIIALLRNEKRRDHSIEKWMEFADSETQEAVDRAHNSGKGAPPADAPVDQGALHGDTPF